MTTRTEAPNPAERRRGGVARLKSQVGDIAVTGLLTRAQGPVLWGQQQPNDSLDVRAQSTFCSWIIGLLNSPSLPPSLYLTKKLRVGKPKMDFLKVPKWDPLGRDGVKSLKRKGRPPTTPLPKSAPAPSSFSRNKYFCYGRISSHVNFHKNWMMWKIILFVKIIAERRKEKKATRRIYLTIFQLKTAFDRAKKKIDSFLNVFKDNESVKQNS